MAADVNDKFQKLGGASSIVNTPRVTATRSGGGTTLTVDNCNWDQTTGKIFATYQADTSGNVVDGTQTIWKGIVTSSTSIGSLARIAGANDTGNAIGDYVELLPASAWANTLVDGILTHADQDGTLKAGAVDNAAVLASDVVETAKIKDANVTTDKLADEAVTAGKIDFGGSGSGIWWEEIGRTTLASAGDTITVSSLPARKYMRIMVVSILATGSPRTALRFNNDSGANYQTRQSSNGGADTTGGPYNEMRPTTGTLTNVEFCVVDIVNISNKEKTFIGHSSENNGTGTGTTPDRREQVGKWVNTSAQITRVDLINVGTGTYAAGSEVVVLGHD